MPAGWVYANEMRKWTPEEVDEAIASIKKRLPEVWAELERVEAAAGDFTGVKEYDIHAGLVVQHFKIESLIDLTNLLAAIRMKRRAGLGLTPGVRESREV